MLWRWRRLWFRSVLSLGRLCLSSIRWILRLISWPLCAGLQMFFDGSVPRDVLFLSVSGSLSISPLSFGATTDVLEQLRLVGDLNLSLPW